MYSNVCNLLEQLRQREEDDRNNKFNQLCEREHRVMLDCFKMAGLNVESNEISSQELTSERSLTVEFKQEQATAPAARNGIVNETYNHSMDDGVAESKQSAMPTSPTAARGNDNTSHPMQSMWLVETSLRLRRELVCDFENRKHASVLAQRRKSEEARLRAMELIRRRQEEAMYQAMLLEETVAKRESTIEKERAIYLTLQTEISKQHTAMKSWQLQQDMYVWLLTDILCIGAYSFTSTSCGKRKDFRQWLLTTMLAICKHFSNSSNNKATNAYASSGRDILSVVTNSWHQLLRSINQSFYAVLLSPMIWSDEWRERMAMVSESMSCVVSLVLYFFVPLLVSRVLVYFRCLYKCLRACVYAIVSECAGSL